MYATRNQPVRCCCSPDRWSKVECDGWDCLIGCEYCEAGAFTRSSTDRNLSKIVGMHRKQDTDLVNEAWLLIDCHGCQVVVTQLELFFEVTGFQLVNHGHQWWACVCRPRAPPVSFWKTSHLCKLRFAGTLFSFLVMIYDPHPYEWVWPQVFCADIIARALNPAPKFLPKWPKVSEAFHLRIHPHFMSYIWTA